jgi:hypothetical protein
MEGGPVCEAASITKIGDVVMGCGPSVIILGDTAVKQQVVPPSERTRRFDDSLRSHRHLPKAKKELMSHFVPRISRM